MLARHSPRTSRALHASRRGNIAFGLLALLIVAAIVLYLLFGFGGTTTVTPPGAGGGGGGGAGGGGGYLGAVAGSRKNAKGLASQLNTKQIATLAAQYRQTNNKLPASVADLEAPAPIITDQWGTTVAISFQEVGASTKMSVRSAGPDAQMNTPDDVVTSEDLPF
jgi:hypothetical protein